MGTCPMESTFTEFHCPCFSFVINTSITLKKHRKIAPVTLGTETVKSYLKSIVTTETGIQMETK